MKIKKIISIITTFFLVVATLQGILPSPTNLDSPFIDRTISIADKATFIGKNSSAVNENLSIHLNYTEKETFNYEPTQWNTPNDKKIVTKLQKKIAARKNYFKRKIHKYEAKVQQKLAKQKEKRAKFFLDKVEEAKLGYTEMQQAEKELEILSNSPIKITFIFNEENISYTYMDTDGTIVVEFNSYVNAIHELTHVFQHLNSQIEYLAGTGGAIYIDLSDELSAYKRQYFFAPYSFNKLRSDSYIKIRKSANIRYFWVEAIYFMRDGKKYYPYKKLKTFPTNKPQKEG